MMEPLPSTSGMSSSQQKETPKSTNLKGKDPVKKGKARKVFECTKCKARFASADDLTNHLSTSHVKKHHKCPECFQNFVDNGSFQRHLKLHVETQFSPNSMNEEIPSEIHHPRGSGRKFRCKHCDRSYSSRAYLTKHVCRAKEQIPFVAEEIEVNTFCEVCKKDYCDKLIFRNHECIPKKGNEERVDHECIPSEGNEERVEAREASPENVPQNNRKVCPMCEEEVSNLNSHINIHIGIYDVYIWLCWNYNLILFSESYLRTEPTPKKVRVENNPEGKKGRE